MFCLPQHIESYSTDMFGALAGEHHLRGLPRDAYVGRLTYYFAEVDAIHPFRECNGGTQRAFFRQRSQAAGRRLDWSTLDLAKNASTSMARQQGTDAAHICRQPGQRPGRLRGHPAQPSRPPGVTRTR